jgi:hypothetical protein
MCARTATAPLLINIVPHAPGSPNWTPAVGQETEGLSLPPTARLQIVDEASRILSRCMPPHAARGSLTGLVVGHVQSGKTTAFTTLAALARDNGYRLVVIIAGTTIPLFKQNRDRLVHALRLDSRPRSLPWRHITQPTVAKHAHTAIADALAQWASPTATDIERRTLLLTVMKHHQHLQNLTTVLQRVSLEGIPTLIIDDEGDQAGLNTKVRVQEQSPTYSRILEVKRLIPTHSYVQFTATPQAPLLINLVDALSPSFAEVLTPGEGYVGGTEFFVSHPNLVRQIPAAEIPAAGMIPAAPPPSLLDALRLFFIGVAVGYSTTQPHDNCSMMVHPSQRTDPHHQFYTWVSRIREQWLQILDLAEDDPDRHDLLEQFRGAYADICETHAESPPWQELAKHLRRAISQTEIREVNARGRRTPAINWGESYSWILVGGQAMDRGFTVQGLTVTYMPRNLGLGNADTVQQRARFFGYKRAYLGLCRVYVGADVNTAFRTYVEHEADMRQELRDFSATGRPLSEWRRQFFLARQLRPTRDNVIDIAYQRLPLGNKWIFPNCPHESLEAIESNRQLLAELRAHFDFQEDDGLDLRQGENRNLKTEPLPLRLIHEALLTRYRVTHIDDSYRLSAVLRLVQLHLMQDTDAECTIYLMANGNPRRRDYVNDQIVELFQGEQFVSRGSARVMTYPGDRQVRATHGLSIQMNNLTLGPRQGPLIAENIPHLAVWIPNELARDALWQPQGGRR